MCCRDNTDVFCGDRALPLLCILDPERCHYKCDVRDVFCCDRAGSSIENVIDVTSFLVDMDRDFSGYNEVWAETLGKVGPTRTTLAISALPTPIAVEMKVIAKV